MDAVSQSSAQARTRAGPHPAFPPPSGELRWSSHTFVTISRTARVELIEMENICLTGLGQPIRRNVKGWRI